VVINKFPLWKNLVLIALFIIGVIYAAPVFFGEDPAVQIVRSNGELIKEATVKEVTDLLASQHIPYKSVTHTPESVLIRFSSLDEQLTAQSILKNTLGSEQYTVAISLASATPQWLEKLGAFPMKLGLDLRGGVNFLLEVDVDSVLKRRLDGDMRLVVQELRENSIRYAGQVRNTAKSFTIKFRNKSAQDAGYELLRRRLPDYAWAKVTDGQADLYAVLTEPALDKIRQNVIEQTMTTLRNRVNELGVSEAVVQQQGVNRVSVDLPGIQDAAQAKQILGGTATLEFHLVDTRHDVMSAVRGNAPPGTKLYEYDGRPHLLKNEVILKGESITGATATFDEHGQPAVNIRLGGGGERRWNQETRANVGKPLAIIYIETKTDEKLVHDQTERVQRRIENVISIANIKQALGLDFQVSGLKSQREAQNLALMLRAGALPTPLFIVAERTVGPSLGKENIKMGTLSVIVGTASVMLFMLVYYGFFGLIANIALLLNLVFILTLLSLLGATLTLPGIAGIVLTMGMAIDANVLIFERIREELRNGLSIQASINAGYEKAFGTIVDSNVTTLIVAVILFGIGSGAVKGFAVTLIIGLLASMLTAITYTRAIVNGLYGGRQLKRISIGI